MTRAGTATSDVEMSTTTQESIDSVKRAIPGRPRSTAPVPIKNCVGPTPEKSTSWILSQPVLR
jgi:hypothetical protein